RVPHALKKFSSHQNLCTHLPAARLDYPIIVVLSMRLERQSDWERNLNKPRVRRQKKLCSPSRSSSGIGKVWRKTSAACQRKSRIERAVKMTAMQHLEHKK